MEQNKRVAGSALAALSALTLGVGMMATPPVAQAQSSSSSIVDEAGSSVNLGSEMGEVPERDAPVYRSGLPDVEPQGEPGTVLAEVPLDVNVGLSSASEQYRIAYTTVDQHGKPAVSTGAVYLPEGEKPEGGWPVLAWAHGTVGQSDECAPSINPLWPVEEEYLNTFLDEGYAIVATDYVGLDSPGFHSYLNGKVAAENVVDSVAAAHQMDATTDTEPVLADEWAVIGQSQGGGVALHVAHRATELSEDLESTTAAGWPRARRRTLGICCSPLAPRSRPCRFRRSWERTCSTSWLLCTRRTRTSTSTQRLPTKAAA